MNIENASGRETERYVMIPIFKRLFHLLICVWNHIHRKHKHTPMTELYS